MSSIDTQLNNIRWKLWRAKEITEQIDGITKEFLQSRFYTVALEQDREGRLVVKIDTVEPMPPIISILIGEASHHIRSSLDNLMFILAKPDPGKEDKVQFPITSSSERFRNSYWRMPNIPVAARNIVESVQPYHRRKWPETRVLGQIQSINNWDKHRAFATSAAAIESSFVEFKVVGNTRVVHKERFTGQIKSKKVIARCTVGASEVGAKIAPIINIGCQPVFDKTMPKEIRGINILGAIGGAGHFIEHEVLPRLEQYV